MHIVYKYSIIYYICLVAIPIHAEDTNFVAKARNWFEWGEYEKLTTEVLPILERHSADLQGSSNADLRIYVGVALFSLGKIGEARKRFMQALTVDSTAIVDERYVTQEILDLFAACRMESQKEACDKTIRDSLFRAQVQLVKKQEETRRTEERRVRKRLQRSIAASAASLLLTSVCIGTTFYEYRQTQSAYRDFRAAAAAGDLARYNRSKSLTVRGDILTAVSGVLALASGGSSTFFFVKAVRQCKR